MEMMEEIWCLLIDMNRMSMFKSLFFFPSERNQKKSFWVTNMS